MRKQSPRAAALLMFLVLSAASVSAAQLVSVNAAGTDSGNFGSYVYALNADGRFVVFTSDAEDLVANPTTAFENVYVRDMQTGVTTLVSVNQSGTDGGNGNSRHPWGEEAISANGRFVVFESLATNLGFVDANGVRDIYRRDLQTATTTLISINAAGTSSGNSDSMMAAMTPDGRYVVFESRASNLGAIDANGVRDVYLRDAQTGTTILVSVNGSGVAGNGESHSPSITADGRYVGFVTEASDLGPMDTNGVADVYLRDLQTGTTTLITVNANGTDSGDGGAIGDHEHAPRISAGGRFVAFVTNASDLGSTDTNGVPDVYVRDRQTATTTLISVNFSGTDSGALDSYNVRITPDGRFIAFESFADDLVPNDANNFSDVFVHDLVTGTLTLVSVNLAGDASGDSFSNAPRISDDGRVVTFRSGAFDLVPNDTGTIGHETGDSDAFARDLQTGTTVLLSANADGSDSVGVSDEPRISADGRYAVFPSASNLFGYVDTNDLDDIYRAGTGVGPAPDGMLGSSGGTVADDSGTGATFTAGPGVLPDGTRIFIDVLPDPGALPPPGFAAFGTYFVDFTLQPNPSPLAAPGATLVLPLRSPLAEGSSLSLFKYDPTSGTFTDTGIVGTVDAGGATATFAGVTGFSMFVGLVPSDEVIEVTIDIKPGSATSSINLGSKGNVPVAILSDASFDARDVDPATVRLAGALARRASVEDVNQDGRPDLVLHVRTQDLMLDPGDTEAVLTGGTFDGRAIEGRDSVTLH